MNTRIRSILATPILAGGILAATLTAAGTAVAAPDSGSCGSMAMPSTQAAAGGPSSLTRAGQVGAATAPAASAPDSPMGCSAQGHS